MKQQVIKTLNVTLSKEEVAQCVLIASNVCASWVSSKKDGTVVDISNIPNKTDFLEILNILREKCFDNIQETMKKCEKMNVIVGRDN